MERAKRTRFFLSCSCQPGRRTCPLCFSNRLVNAELERPFMTSLNKFEQKFHERDPACSKNVRCCCDLRHFSFCRDPSTVRQPCVSALQSSACLLSISVLQHKQVEESFAVRAVSSRNFTPTVTLANTYNT